ncbi:MAG: hypothetical protein ACO1O1_07820 [Adhaeribacter sp.]
MKKYFLLIASFTLISGSLLAQTPAGKFTDLGTQLSAALIQGSAFVQDPQGRELVYTVVRGRPAHLLGYEIKTNKLIVDLEVPQTDGVWDLEVSSDGMLYVPSANGILFRHLPGSQQLERLGEVLPGEKVIWDLTAGKDGEIFGGTYPGARVFRYHPRQGFSDLGRGPVVEKENYVRSVAYQPQTGKVYAGVASHSHLIELDPKTGQKRELLPAEHQDQEAIYHLSLVPGLKGGDRLIGWLTSSTERQTVVYNLKNGQLEHLLPTIDVKSAIRGKSKKDLYYVAGGKLFLANLNQKHVQPRELAQLGGEAKDMAWARDGQLQVVTASHRVYRYHPKTGKTTEIKLDIPGQPIDIQTIGLGPDGRIWTGGYLAGSHAAYDPKTGKTERYAGLDQTEGMAVQGNTIYFGIYAKARLYAYDNTKPWNLKQNNPKSIGKIEGQDRPFAVLPHDQSGKVFFGTVPGYGMLGGALVEYEPKTGAMETFSGVVPGQSIVTLAQAGNLVIGGSSIFGGLGILPTENEAKLFAWDVNSRKKVFEMPVLPGAMAITGLINGPDGRLWGFADGTLFVFDLTQRKVVRTHEYYKIKGRPSHIWRNGSLMVHPSGQVYGNINDKAFRIDPKTLQFIELFDNVSLLTLDDQGSFYFRRKANLWKYEP